MYITPHIERWKLAARGARKRSNSNHEQLGRIEYRIILITRERWKTSRGIKWEDKIPAIRVYEGSEKAEVNEQNHGVESKIEKQSIQNMDTQEKVFL